MRIFSKTSVSISFFAGAFVGAAVVFCYVFLHLIPQINSALAIDDQQMSVYEQSAQSFQYAAQTCQATLNTAKLSSVMIAEPAAPGNQVGEFFGSLFAAFFGHPGAAKQLIDQVNSNGMQPRFFINTASYQVASYTSDAAVFYYYDTSKKQWVGPNEIPPVESLIKSNLAK